MEIYGPDLGMPYTRAMGQGLFEIRSKAAEGIARVFCCAIVDRQPVMLHQFVEDRGLTSVSTRARRERSSRLAG